ncbi:hypothetical protein LCI18_006803 [Fusarium solani-melongenae]|uniref:Uncharacterized protein n=1 Tax=Fusarium solani subsp. cucurbitae TaxID=2747967 RepID=A0ACD3Z711_FUSSC|nr:hypothetical protein LCI18_006803 [Fusarium solani-melongenae]
MHFTSYLSVAFLALGLTVASPQGGPQNRSPEPPFQNGKYVVSRRAQFTNKKVFTFPGNKLPNGLTASNYPAGDSHSFLPANVKVRNNYLELHVPGGQTKMPYKSAEVVTDVQNIKYASVRTTAIFSEPAGVCNGMFFYQSDTQEIDIEWLSDPQSQSNAGTRHVWFTNQDENGDGKSTYKAVTPPRNPTSTEHEYRVDWTAGLVQFYIDGRRIWQTTQDVPTEPGAWIFNNWSSGDKGWSVGPPVQEAVFKIKQIEMYYNTA